MLRTILRARQHPVLVLIRVCPVLQGLALRNIFSNVELYFIIVLSARLSLIMLLILTPLARRFFISMHGYFISRVKPM